MTQYITDRAAAPVASCFQLAQRTLPALGMVAIVSKVLESADGTKLFAEAAGDPANPALVFIHGFGVSGVAFDAQFEDPRLNENLYLVRYDMRGHARSGMPMDAAAYQSVRHAEDFKTVCEGFGLTKPNVLGWSVHTH